MAFSVFTELYTHHHTFKTCILPSYPLANKLPSPPALDNK